MSAPGPIWICDYDIPVEPKSRRMAFYRGLWAILETHNIVTTKSTQSVWVLDSEEIAREIHEHALQFVGKTGASNLYNATPVD